jgi:hypothetical protein
MNRLDKHLVQSVTSDNPGIVNLPGVVEQKYDLDKTLDLEPFHNVDGKEKQYEPTPPLREGTKRQAL